MSETAARAKQAVFAAVGAVLSEREADAIIRDINDAQHEVLSLRQRAEQAERERDEARKQADAFCAKFSGAQAARERAEADNAALLKTLTSIVATMDAHRLKLAGVGVDVDFPPHVRDMLLSDHPGAALLERLRALEEVREAADRAYVCGKAECVQCNNLGAALAAYDAMKVPRE